MKILEAKKILVTGGHGFFGGAIVNKLIEKGVDRSRVFAPLREECDLMNQAQLAQLFLDISPDIVIHVAAAVGGIGKNKNNPGSLYYSNVMMNTNMMEYSMRAGVKKYVAIGSGCVYPEIAEMPFKEIDIWNGYPEPITAPYGISKKIQIVQAKAYFDEYGFDASVCLPTNLYGPNDHFDLTNGHVVSSLIRKFIEAVDSESNQLVCWGDGSPTRDFIYIEDAALAVLTVVEKSSPGEAINIATGIEVSISELVKMLAEITGFKGEIKWDTSKPNGQLRRCYDISKIRSMGFSPSVDLVDGLKKTVDWFRNKK